MAFTSLLINCQFMAARKYVKGRELGLIFGNKKDQP